MSNLKLSQILALVFILLSAVGVWYVIHRVFGEELLSGKILALESLAVTVVAGAIVAEEVIRIFSDLFREVNSGNPTNKKSEKRFGYREVCILFLTIFLSASFYAYATNWLKIHAENSMN